MVVQRTARKQKRKEVYGRAKERVNGEIEGNVVEDGGMMTSEEGKRETRHCVHGEGVWMGRIATMGRQQRVLFKLTLKTS